MVECNTVNAKLSNSQLNKCSSRPRTAGCSGHCEQVDCHGETVTIRPATTLLFSCALSNRSAAGSLCRIAD